MYIELSVFVGLCALYFYLNQNFNFTLRKLLNEIAYQSYYYVLGFKGIVEDLVFSGHNKINLSPKNGEVAVITGGARGIGVEVVRKLLQCGIHVIIGCRNVEAGKETVRKIRKSGVISGEAVCIALDIGNFSSVRLFAAEVLKKVSRIDYLINNAGIMFVPYAETEDGFESQFAVNYLGHCLLTHLLLPCMITTGKERCSNSRIVNVTSCGHLAGSINFPDVNMRKNYIASASYAQSKLAQILFTKSLDSKLKNLNIPVQVHSVHPGIVNTDLFNGTGLKMIAPFVPALLFKTPEQGAVTTVYACISPELEGKGGDYLSNCRTSEASNLANNKQIQDKLWNVMLSFLKIEKFGDVIE